MLLTCQLVSRFVADPPTVFHFPLPRPEGVDIAVVYAYVAIDADGSFQTIASRTMRLVRSSTRRRKQGALGAGCGVARGTLTLGA